MRFPGKLPAASIAVGLILVIQVSCPPAAMAANEALDVRVSAASLEDEGGQGVGPAAEDAPQIIEKVAGEVQGVEAPYPNPKHMWSMSDSPDADIATIESYGTRWGTKGGQQAFYNADGSVFACPAIKVIDVSEWQGVIDWDAFKRENPNGAAILRIGYGEGVEDDYFARNLAEVKRLGIPYGVYLYSYAYDAAFAREEAKGTDRLLDKYGARPSLGIFYDLEAFSTWGGHAHPTNPATYEQIVRAYYDVLMSGGWNEDQIHVYSYRSYLHNELNSPYLHSKTTWAAEYGPKLKYTFTAKGQIGWQYTSSERIAGVSGNCDVSAFTSGDEDGRPLSELGSKDLGVTEGDYYLVSALTGVGGKVNGVLGTDYGSTANGAGVSLFGMNASASQVYRISKTSAGRYVFKSKYSGKLLDASGPSYANGTSVVQWDANGGLNQEWELYRDPSGWYYIASAYAGSRNKVIDVSGNKPIEGADVQLWGASGVDGQRFRLVPVSEYKPGCNGWTTVSDGQQYWYDEGVRAEGKAIFDRDAKQWRWIDPGGIVARDKDAFIPQNGSGKWVRLDSNGFMVKGEDFRYGGWYFFDLVTGEMAKGVRYIASNGGKWVYYDVIDGKMHHGETYISYDAEHTGWYYFDIHTGAMAHGDVYMPSNGGKWVRYDRVSGKMIKGLHKQDGAWYYFDPITGAMAHGRTWVPEWGVWHVFDRITGRG